MRWKLFYDGGCNLCHVSKLRVEKWAERKRFPLDVEIVQSEEGVRKGYGSAMVLETEDGALFGADAWLELMKLAPWHMNWLHYLGHFPGMRSLLKWGYGIVAKYRYKWFGTRACPIPTMKPPAEPS